MVILVADDDLPILRLWARMLDRLGHRCVTASTGNDLILRCSRLMPDLIISDVELGGQDGITICSRLRRDRPGLPVALVSGDPNHVRRAREAGFKQVLQKPFTLEQVKALLAFVSSQDAG